MSNDVMRIPRGQVDVIDIAWKGVLYGLYSREPEGQSPKDEWLYKPYSTPFHAICVVYP